MPREGREGKIQDINNHFNSDTVEHICTVKSLKIGQRRAAVLTAERWGGKIFGIFKFMTKDYTF